MTLKQLKQEVCRANLDLVKKRLVIQTWGNASGIDRDHGYPYDFGAVELEGLRNARYFDPASNDWVEAAPMKYGRWYPSLVTMPDGKVTVFSGVTKLLKSTQMGQVRRTETFDPATNTWTENYVGDESETALPLFSRLTLMPNGKVLYIYEAGNTIDLYEAAGFKYLRRITLDGDMMYNTFHVVRPRPR